VIVGQDEQDLEIRRLAAQAGHGVRGLVELRAGGQQRCAVLERPALVLRVRELESRRAEPPRERRDRGDAREVVAVQHDVHREGKAQLAHGRRRIASLAVEALGARDRVGACARASWIESCTLRRPARASAGEPVAIEGRCPAVTRCE
jgi:hypothetical protein